MALTLQSTGAGNHTVYLVNGGAGQAPDWVAKKGSKKGKGRSNEDGSLTGKGIRLIQDLDFPEASNKIKSSRDGKYLLATGTYKPRMKVFELDELGMKFARTTDAENVDFEILSDDWTKTLHLQADRSVELHNQASAFYRTRIPKAGRALGYHYPSCDALVGGLGGHVFRLNLEQGRFLNPFALQGNPEDADAPVDEDEDAVVGVNAIDVNPAHHLLSFGTEVNSGKGTVEFWDQRVRRRVGILSLPYNKLASSTSSASAQLPGLSLLDPDNKNLNSAQLGVTALASKSDGLNLAVGTSTGHTLLYDLRSPTPYTIKDQGYGLPIKKIQWPTSHTDHADGPLVATADSKIVKIWHSSPSASAKNFVAINPPSSINDIHIYPDSGLMFLANEQSAVTSYYIPGLGMAPRWCRFLDHMTEEMEDDQQTSTLYEDYKFVDRQELASLNLDHLIGTPTLRPYMHGFFLDLRLYSKAKAIANPFAYSEYRQQLIAQRLEKERESRIRAKKGLQPKMETLGEKYKVNQQLAERIKVREEKERNKKRKAEEEEAAAKEGEKDKAEPSLLADDRFGSLFTDKAFTIDEGSKEFAMLNPSAAARASNRRDQGEDDEVQSGDDEDGQNSDSSAENELVPYIAPTKRQRDISTIQSKPSTSAPQMIIERGSTSKLSSARPDAAATFGEMSSKRSGRTVSLGTTQPRDQFKSLGGGGMEYSFVPSTTADDEEKEERKAARKAKLAKDNTKKSEFGVGLQKGVAEKEEGAELTGEDRAGRTRHRKIARSASNSAIKRQTSGNQRMRRK